MRTIVTQISPARFLFLVSLFIFLFCFSSIASPRGTPRGASLRIYASDSTCLHQMQIQLDSVTVTRQELDLLKPGLRTIQTLPSNQMCLNHQATIHLVPDSITWWHTPRRRRPFVLDRSPVSSHEILLQGSIHGYLSPVLPNHRNFALSLGKRWNPWWYTRFGFEPQMQAHSQWNAETGFIHPHWLQEFALGIQGHTSIYAQLLQNIHVSPWIAQLQLRQHLLYTQLKTNSTWATDALAVIHYSHPLWNSGLSLQAHSPQPYKSFRITPGISIGVFPHPFWNFNLQFKTQAHPRLWKQFQLKLSFQRHFLHHQTTKIKSPNQNSSNTTLTYLSAQSEKIPTIHPDYSAPESHIPDSINMAASNEKPITLSQLETILNLTPPDICQKAQSNPQSPLNHLLWQHPFWLTDPSDHLHSFRYYSGSPQLNHLRGCQEPLNLIGENTNPHTDSLRILKVKQLPTFFSNTP